MRGRLTGNSGIDVGEEGLSSDPEECDNGEQQTSRYSQGPRPGHRVGSRLQSDGVSENEKSRAGFVANPGINGWSYKSSRWREQKGDQTISGDSHDCSIRVGISGKLIPTTSERMRKGRGFQRQPRTRSVLRPGAHHGRNLSHRNYEAVPQFPGKTFPGASFLDFLPSR